MSRGGARREPEAKKSGTPVWVIVIYVAGALGAAVFAFSLLFTAGAYFLSDDVELTVNTSLPAAILWLGLMALAAGTWYRRRR